MKKQRTEKELAEIQIQFELDMKSTGINRFTNINNRAIDKGVASETLYNRRIISELVQPMASGIDAFKEHFKGQAGRRNRSLMYLNRLDSRQAAYITIKVIIDCLVKDFELRKTTEMIGQRIEDQVRFCKLHDQASGYVDKLEESMRSNNTDHYEHKRKVYIAAENKLYKNNHGTEFPVSLWRNWGDKDVRLLGADLVDIFSKTVLFEDEPVVYKHFSVSGKGNSVKSLIKLMPTSNLLRWIDEFKEAVGEMSPAYAPCVVKPAERVSPYVGGYHIKDIASTLPLVKGRKSQIGRLSKEQMPLVYKATNYFQNVSWQVNDKVLDIVEKVIASGLGLGLPQTTPYEFPVSPIDKDTTESGAELKLILGNEEYEEFVEWKRETTRLYKEESSRKSAIAGIVRTVGQARKYQSFENIHFVYKLDSRNRFYPVGDSLQPQGSDIQKGLLRLTEEKEFGTAVCKLGLTSLDWFYIVGSNLMGVDKCSFTERVSYVAENIDSFLDMASDPLTHREWAGADKPWQFLSWCFELERLQAHLDNGHHYSTFKTAQRGGLDGSCSGLQHYSAILRDKVCGEAVNLINSGEDKPSDIYGVVAGKVVKTMLDESEEIEFAQAWLSIHGGISRGLTKKPVMTLVYGSTMITCREAIQVFIEDLQKKENKKAKGERREPIKVHSFGDSIPMKESLTYATSKVWGSIGETVPSAINGMKFIQDLAKRLVETGNHLEYISPVGFIFEQRIYEKKINRVKTKMFGCTYIWVPEETKKLNLLKMKSAAAPNFIHNCDATHVVLAGNACEDAGIALNCIHDDFETHISSMGQLHSILKTTFVELHTEDLLDRLLTQNEERTCRDMKLVLPNKGELNLEDVLDSTYIFG